MLFAAWSQCASFLLGVNVLQGHHGCSMQTLTVMPEEPLTEGSAET